MLAVRPSEGAAKGQGNTNKPTKHVSCKKGMAGVAKREGQIQLERCLDTPLSKEFKCYREKDIQMKEGCCRVCQLRI